MGEVRKLWIEGRAGRLEARLRLAAPSRAVAVIAHPHPLHGGTLHNPVVFHSDRELNRVGLSTLRFNFRGVEDSDGEHDEGRGEEHDVAAAVAWMRAMAIDVPLIVVGYSFGSLCGIRHAARNRTVAAVIAIGLPVGRYPTDEVSRLDRPVAVVQGGEDSFGSPEEIEPLLKAARPEGRLWVIRGAPHLFPGRAAEVGETVAEAADWVLSKLQ